jgi:hypothetical protein
MMHLEAFAGVFCLIGVLLDGEATMLRSKGRLNWIGEVMTEG